MTGGCPCSALLPNVEPGGRPDLDTLATALCVTIDELLLQAQQLAPPRPHVGLAPKLSDVELSSCSLLALWHRDRHALDMSEDWPAERSTKTVEALGAVSGEVRKSRPQRSAGSAERLVKVVDEVIGVLEADRQSQQVVHQSASGPVGGCAGLVLDQALPGHQSSSRS
jgi:hypothetical protein